MVRGVTQQPWAGALIDIPIEKMLLFRPAHHKGNPEGRSVLRNAYRSYFFVKRMSGFPVCYVPSSLIEKAQAPIAAGAQASPDQLRAQQSYQAIKDAVTGVRVNEQMGLVLPGDPFRNPDGTATPHKMFDFQLVTPQRSRGVAETDKMIARYQVNMLMTLICDFLMMGHEVRGTNNLSITRVDKFYAAIEGWLNGIADVLNRYGLTRLWDVNGFSRDLMPSFLPDMPQRLDLDSLGGFIKNIAAAGMPLFPDEELEAFIRDAAGFPLIEDMTPGERQETIEDRPGRGMNGKGGNGNQT